MPHDNEAYQGKQPGPGTGGPASEREAPVREVDLGTSIVVYYSDGSYEVLPKSRFAPQGSAPASLSPNTIYGEQQQNLRSGATNEIQRQTLAEQIRQYNETFGKDKAEFNTEFPLEQGKITGYYSGAPTLDREMFGEDQRQYDTTNAINFYKYQSDLASNPRNFMQQLFTMRGQAAPPGSERFANGPGFSANQPFGQFFQNFQNTAGAFGPSQSQYRYGAQNGGVDYSPPPAPPPPQTSTVTWVTPGGVAQIPELENGTVILLFSFVKLKKTTVETIITTNKKILEKYIFIYYIVLSIIKHFNLVIPNTFCFIEYFRKSYCRWNI